MNIPQTIGVIMYIIVMFSIILLLVWTIIAKSAFYKAYITKKRTKILLGQYNTIRVQKKRELLKQKILDVPVVNTSIESIEDAESFLNFSVQPIIFEENVIYHELEWMKFNDKVLKNQIDEQIIQGIIPIRTQFASPIRGIDQYEDARQCFLQRYPASAFFMPDYFLSPLFMDTLLTKNIVLFELYYYRHDFGSQIDILLIPYQRKVSNQSVDDHTPVFPHKTFL